jgi:hypothetical protein
MEEVQFAVIPSAARDLFLAVTITIHQNCHSERRLRSEESLFSLIFRAGAPTPLLRVGSWFSLADRGFGVCAKVLVTREGATSVVPYVLGLALAAEVSTFPLVQKKE